MSESKRSGKRAKRGSGAHFATTSAPKRATIVPMVIKYLFPLGLCLAAFLSIHGRRMLAFQLVELALIFLITNTLANANLTLGYVLTAILILLFDVQVAVLFFGNTYLSMVMVTNLEFLGDVSGNAIPYIAVAMMCVVTALLPISHVEMPLLPSLGALALLVVVEFAAASQMGGSYSPLYAYCRLGRQYQDYQARRAEVRARNVDAEDYYQQGVADGVRHPSNLTRTPNIVIIFTEGLSQHIIEDERNIMPNVHAYLDQSLSFENYYNHTSPTLRGLMGQLYSGHQNDNYDTNKLVSLMAILRERGYESAFINTEPNSVAFDAYTNSLGFDEVIGDKQPDDGRERWGGPMNSMSDREAYDLLFTTMESMASDDRPFLIGIYTFGTHATLDSPDEVYGDGTDAELNKFYNADVWFGEFMERFEASPLANNTLIVFTTDHATYGDKAFSGAFGDHARGHYFLDEIPLFFYYAGVEPAQVDAGGRNSLDFAPTLLDYIDISEPNYFLGTSLFVEQDNELETYYSEPGTYMKSTDDEIQRVEGDELEWFEEELTDYFAAAAGEPSFVLGG